MRRESRMSSDSGGVGGKAAGWKPSVLVRRQTVTQLSSFTVHLMNKILTDTSGTESEDLKRRSRRCCLSF